MIFWKITRVNATIPVVMILKNKKKLEYDVTVIGGGASGLMASICAARTGATVAIIEHNNRVGKKILSTGNGKCNYTNESMGTSYYYGADPDFIASILKQFSRDDTLAFFQELGIQPLVQRGGYYYPASEQAQAVLDVLRMEMRRLKIPTYLDLNIRQMRKCSDYFEIHLSDGTLLSSRKVILATGGAAASKLGSDGTGYALATQLGHHVIPLVPALVALEASDAWCKSLAGVRAKGKVSLLIDGKLIAEDQGEIQFTAQGISGIPVFQISRFAAYGCLEKKTVTAVIQLFPDYSAVWMEELLFQRFHSRGGDKTCEEACIGLLNKKLIPILLQNAGISCTKLAVTIESRQIKKLARELSHFTFHIVGTKGLESAQVTAGGIDVNEVHPESLESRLCPGLYFAGEILNVDGICGGYNLQWAWSSGYVTGTATAKECI